MRGEEPICMTGYYPPLVTITHSPAEDLHERSPVNRTRLRKGAVKVLLCLFSDLRVGALDVHLPPGMDKNLGGA